MSLSGCRIGIGITGSFCTFDKIKIEIQKLTEAGAEVTPVFSFHTQKFDTRFGKADDFMKDVETITGKVGLKTIQEAEPVGPKQLFDVFVIAPCTGNTLAKLNHGIIDTPVLMAAKSHIRNERPVVISISTNDALGINFRNVGEMMNRKNIYFVPFSQDDPSKKPNSMIAHVERIPDTIEKALSGKQIQPIVL